MVIYIVEGETGEDADRRSWPIKAFVSENRAELYTDLANARAAEIYKVLRI